MTHNLQACATGLLHCKACVQQSVALTQSACTGAVKTKRFSCSMTAFLLQESTAWFQHFLHLFEEAVYLQVFAIF